MDREAAVIRSEMSQTRADLDRKLTALEARAHEMTPRRIVERNMPEYFWETAIGSVLTLTGLKMAWSRYRHHSRRRRQVRAAVASYGRW
jgi:hypothetical protein